MINFDGLKVEDVDTRQTVYAPIVHNTTVGSAHVTLER